MNLIEVNSPQTVKDFHNTARKIYAEDKNWVCPLEAEIEGIFDRKKNSCYEHGDAIRWILKDDNGNLIGRTAAFFDKRKAYNHDYPAGGMGFFECIDNQEAANILFNNSKEWLAAHGMEAMDGPVNFGENLNNWGLLVDGFDRPTYGMQYHPPYYKDLFENYGFRNFFEQFTYLKDLTQPFPERQAKFARHVGENPDYTFETFKFSNSKKYIRDLVHIFNTVWAEWHDDFAPLKESDIEQVLMDAKPILNENFIWFGYDKGEPVAMVVGFPDVNQILAKLNGKLDFFGKLKFLYHKKTTKITRVRHLLTGVVPSHQRTYIIGAVFLKLADAIKDAGIMEHEMSWVGDYNTGVIKIYNMLGLPVIKTHVTYRFLFDPNAEFRRFMSEEKTKKTS